MIHSSRTVTIICRCSSVSSVSIVSIHCLALSRRGVFPFRNYLVHALFELYLPMILCDFLMRQLSLPEDPHVLLSIAVSIDYSIAFYDVVVARFRMCDYRIFLPESFGKLPDSEEGNVPLCYVFHFNHVLIASFSP